MRRLLGFSCLLGAGGLVGCGAAVRERRAALSVGSETVLATRRPLKPLVDDDDLKMRDMSAKQFVGQRSFGWRTVGRHQIFRYESSIVGPRPVRRA